MKELYRITRTLAVTVALGAVVPSGAWAASPPETTKTKPGTKTTSKGAADLQRIEKDLQQRQDPKKRQALEKDLARVEKAGADLGAKLDAQLNGRGDSNAKKTKKPRATQPRTQKSKAK